MKPFIKWAGGKKQLLSEINKLLPDSINDLIYVEPFIGGGAVFFDLEPNRAVINDSNTELINAYNVIMHDCDNLIAILKTFENTKECFYNIREVDRNNYENISPIMRAARFIFLNKTCFNGLYRVNSKGYFNTPWGGQHNQNFCNEEQLRETSEFLLNHNIDIYCKDYKDILDNIYDNSFVYIDPPYYPITDTSFVSYTAESWGEAEHRQLKEYCDKLTERGIKFLASNSYCDFILDLYKDYNIHTVLARRSINSNGDRRGEVKELLIKNY